MSLHEDKVDSHLRSQTWPVPPSKIGCCRIFGNTLILFCTNLQRGAFSHLACMVPALLTLLAVANPLQAQAKLYWLTGNGEVQLLQRANLDGSGVKTLNELAAPEPGAALAFDSGQAALYYLQPRSLPAQADEILRFNLDGRFTEPAVSRQASFIRSFAFDASAKALYWSEEFTSAAGFTTRRAVGTIFRATFTGDSLETIIATAGVATALVAGGGYVYWYDEVSREIWRLPSERIAEPQFVVADSSARGLSLALDTAHGKLYWISEAVDGAIIRRANLDGSEVQEVVTGFGAPFRLALDALNERLYFSDRQLGGIWRTGLAGDLEGGEIEPLPIPELGLVSSLAVDSNNRHPQRLQPFPNIQLAIDDTEAVLDLAGFFTDPDGDVLFFEVATTAPRVVEAAVDGPELFVRPLARGIATVTVSAFELRGGIDSTTFVVTVGEQNQASFTRITAGAIVTDAGGSRGIAWGDFDNDGFDDLFVANTDGAAPNFLYRNNRDGTFTRITTGAIVTEPGQSVAASWGDYDNDGFLDLFVANLGGNNFLYRNNGNGTFTKITAGAIVNDGGNALGCAWGDYDNDGFLDLFVANAGPNFLYRNNGNPEGSGQAVTFTRITTGAIATDAGNSHACAWADYDNDGFIDLFVANRNNEPNFLYRNNGNGTFTRITTGAVVTDTNHSTSGSWGDYDNDGFIDLFVANGNGQNNALYRNNGDGTFTKISNDPIASDGLSVQGSGWADYDNDGFLDLFAANLFGGGDLLFRNNGDGTFARIAAGVPAQKPFVNSHGAAWADYNNDGQMDLFVATATGSAGNLLYRNDGTSNNWLQVRCLGRASNRAGIGAKVLVRATIGGRLVQQVREIAGQTGFGSQSSLTAAFGLGAATRVAELVVQWPSGRRTVLADIAVNQRLAIDENAPPEVVNEIPDFTLLLKDPATRLVIDLMRVFRDEDEDPLSFAATSSDSNIAVPSVTGTILNLTPGERAGIARISVTARDPSGGQATTSFRVTTILDNAAPRIVRALPDTVLVLSPDQGLAQRLVLDLRPVFVDDDGDALTYAARSSDELVAVATVFDDTLRVIPRSLGTTSIVVLAGDGRGGEASTTFSLTVFQSAPPEIVVLNSDIATSGRDFEISVAITDDEDAVAEASLRYRPAGGRQDFVTTPIHLQRDNGIFRGSALIPGASVTNTGVEFVVAALDTHGVPGQHPPRRAGVNALRVSVASPGVRKETPQPAGEARAGYRLISFPLDLADKSPRAILEPALGPFDRRNWRFFEWAATTGGEMPAKIELENIAAIAPGHGYWLIVRDGGAALSTGAGVTVGTASLFPVAIRKGWNLIGNPFNFAVSLQTGDFPGTMLSIFRFVNDWSQPLDPAVALLQPFEGFAVFADSAFTLSIDPRTVPEGGMAAQRARRPEDVLPHAADAVWQIAIRAESGEARDYGTVLGVAHGAAEAHDLLDHIEPPGTGEYISVYFSRPQWQKPATRFTTDFRPPVSDGSEWPFEVESSHRDAVRLVFAGVEQVPSLFDVLLIDDAAQVVHDLRRSNRYAVAGRGEGQPKSLRLVVAPPAYMEANFSALQATPEAFELAQNFPNPFNPATTIRFALPQPVPVSLRIYDLLGQQIRTLIDGEMRDAGHYTVIWDGRSDAGTAVASGVYLYVLRAGADLQVRKMALVR